MIWPQLPNQHGAHTDRLFSRAHNLADCQGEKSPAQLAEEELARKREAERVMRMKARSKSQETGVWFRLGGENDW